MIRDTTATFTKVLKSQADLEEMLTARVDAFWVAEGADAVQGFVTWGTFRGGPGYLHTAEHSIITAASGQGTGRALMQVAEKQAALQGIHTLVAAISGENTAAQAFHARMGFAKTGHLPQVGRKHDRWLDLILMTKTVDPP